MTAAFFSSIASPDLKKIAAHWREARGARAMPSWNDIRPSAIAAQLSIFWAYKYDVVSQEFIGRLAGDRITRMFEKDFRGMKLRDIQPAADYAWVYALCKRVVSEPALYRGEGLMYRHLDRYGKGERIVLPLSSDGETADGIIGATEYKLTPTEFTAPSDPKPAVEEWYPLPRIDRVAS